MRFLHLSWRWRRTLVIMMRRGSRLATCLRDSGERWLHRCDLSVGWEPDARPLRMQQAPRSCCSMMRSGRPLRTTQPPGQSRPGAGSRTKMARMFLPLKKRKRKTTLWLSGKLRQCWNRSASVQSKTCLETCFVRYQNRQNQIKSIASVRKIFGCRCHIHTQSDEGGNSKETTQTVSLSRVSPTRLFPKQAFDIYFIPYHKVRLKCHLKRKFTRLQ